MAREVENIVESLHNMTAEEMRDCIADAVEIVADEVIDSANELPDSRAKHRLEGLEDGNEIHRLASYIRDWSKDHKEA